MVGLESLEAVGSLYLQGLANVSSLGALQGGLRSARSEEECVVFEIRFLDALVAATEPAPSVVLGGHTLCAGLPTQSGTCPTQAIAVGLGCDGGIQPNVCYMGDVVYDRGLSDSLDHLSTCTKLVGTIELLGYVLLEELAHVSERGRA